jgi:transposase
MTPEQTEDLVKREFKKFTKDPDLGTVFFENLTYHQTKSNFVKKVNSEILGKKKYAEILKSTRDSEKNREKLELMREKIEKIFYKVVDIFSEYLDENFKLTGIAKQHYRKFMKYFGLVFEKFQLI